MKVWLATAKNFQSYQTVEFAYDRLGLALISGPTGAGKSTLLDLVSWTLFGTTSKDSAADDVRSWDTDETTESTISVETGAGSIEVTRIRAPGKNDLYWHWTDNTNDAATSGPHRGKDLTETQKLLDVRLGCSAELFMLASYFSQFSKADSFFIAKAKDRRDVLEKIADQEWAISLGDKAAAKRKDAKKLRDDLELKLNKTQGRRDALAEQADRIGMSILDWYKKQGDKIRALSQKFDTFDQDKSSRGRALEAYITTIPEPPTFAPPSLAKAADTLQRDKEVYSELQQKPYERCGACGGAIDAGRQEALDLATQMMHASSEELHKLKEYHRQLKLDAENLARSQKQLAAIIAETNPYGEQLDAAKAEINPFETQQTEVIDNLYAAQASADSLANNLTAAENQVSRLDWLYDASMTLRGLLMQRAVSQLQDKTNDYLERFFEAALRVQFTLEDSDKLDVEISNNGHNCPWRALSGGERGILKLCFSVALMRAAQDKAGIKFDSLFFDEALNGLDDGLKVKAFALFEELEQEYSTILIVDHCEALKAKFNKAFEVTKNGNHSEIYES